MSSLWTPGGERPVGRDVAGQAGRDADRDAGRDVRGNPAGEVAEDGEPMTEAEVAEQMAALQDQLAKTPAAMVVANHCFGLFELAALHLSLQPPQLTEASLAIDALAAVVEGLDDRLGDHAPTLKEGLAQLRLAFVQIRAAHLGEAEPPA